MKLLDRARSVLVLVDYQDRLMPAIHDGAAVLEQALRIAEVARELGVPVFGTEQYPQGLGPNDGALRERCRATIEKFHFDACEDGLLELLGAEAGETAEAGGAVLPNRGYRDIVIAGCEAHVCLLQTALGLLRAGFRVSVIAQASGSRTAENHALAMQRLRQAGAEIVSVEMVAFEWLRSCRHDRFKRVLKLLK